MWAPWPPHDPPRDPHVTPHMTPMSMSCPCGPHVSCSRSCDPPLCVRRHAAGRVAARPAQARQGVDRRPRLALQEWRAPRHDAPGARDSPTPPPLSQHTCTATRRARSLPTVHARRAPALRPSLPSRPHQPSSPPVCARHATLQYTSLTSKRLFKGEGAVPRRIADLKLQREK